MIAELYGKAAMFNLMIMSIVKTSQFCGGGKVTTGLERVKK